MHLIVNQCIYCAIGFAHFYRVPHNYYGLSTLLIIHLLGKNV